MSDSESNIGNTSRPVELQQGGGENLQGGISDDAMAAAINELLSGKRRDDHGNEEIPERRGPVGMERPRDGGGDDGPGGEAGDEEIGGAGEGESNDGATPIREGAESDGEDTQSDGQTENSSAAQAIEKLKDEKGGVYTLKELATALDIAPEALYKMVIPLGDGNEGLTSLEDLKARQKALGPLDEEHRKVKERAAVLEGKQLDHENRVAQARQELTGVVNLVKAFAPPEFIAKAREMSREQTAAEQRKAAEALPKLRDPVSREAWQTDAAEVLADYGITRGEIANFSDHRVFRVVDAFVRMSKRLKELEDLSGDRKPAPKAMKRKGKASRDPNSKVKQLSDRAKKTGQRKDQFAALDAMIDAGTVFIDPGEV